jgi:hypothetical protein
MTDDYKEILFQYITGSLRGTPSSTEEVFMDQIVSNIDLLSLLPSGTTTYFIYGIVSNNDSTGDNYALYGGYDNNGFIAILDNQFNITDVITTFSSGTPLRPIYALEVNTEDNTFFGIDYDGTTNRFIMLNNFTIPNSIGEYVVKLRTSYNFNDNVFYPPFCRIFKNPSSAHYTFVGQTGENNTSVKAIDLKVNVGEENEWTSYTSTYSYSNNAYVEFNSNDNSYITFISSNGTSVRKLTKDFTATTFSATTINSTSGSLFGINPVAFMTKDNFYYSIYDSNNSSLYNYNGSNTLIHSEVLGNMTSYQLKAYNGDLYIYYNTNNGVSPSGQAYYFRYNGAWSPIGISGLNIWSVQTDIFIGSKFNLLKIFMYGKIPIRTESGLLVEDYNKSNYNSTPYVDPTAILPEKARLYTNDNLTFARDEYNITALGNTFTTTVEVPNVYLNSGEIAPSQLVSKTNQIIINNTTPIEKNIYERVYLNFVNSINAYDEDTGNVFDTTNLVRNISGLGNDFNNTYISKLLYLDDTDQVIGENPYLYSRFSTTERLTGNWTFPFTKTSDIYKIAFANSQNEIYGWIDVSNVEDGSWWIKQNVRLADIPFGEQNVLYNDNQVQYNGNDVVYRTSI